MKLSTLLHQREALLRQAHLANLAFAHERLGDFAARIARGRLRGPVSLKRADDDAGRPWPTLTALLGHQSVIEEHFSDEDIIDLADVVGYALEAPETEIVFELAELQARFQEPVRLALQEAGVQIDEAPQALPPPDLQHGDFHSSARDGEGL